MIGEESQRGAGRTRSEFAHLWALDPGVDFLNHGSFGACPLAVLEAQDRLRRRMEAQPVLFLHREMEPLYDAARAALASFLGADAEGLVFVPNATAGVNTVLRSLPLQPGDELLVTDHEYNACRNVINVTAERTGARPVLVHLPFPVAHPDEPLSAIVGAVTSRTRLALVDHVTSQTAMILPVERIAAELEARGVDTLVDGAHAPGMLPLSLDTIGATYYTGNCHKWVCAPKGAGFLWARADRRQALRPLAISHGANMPRSDRPLFRLEFDWTGTHDPTPYLCVAEAIRYLGGLLQGGWPELMERNRTLCLAARRLVAAKLSLEPPCPESMLGSMAVLPLPGSREPLHPIWLSERLQNELYDRHAIETVVLPWPAWPVRWLRISAQLYNDIGQYERLAEKLLELLPRY